MFFAKEKHGTFGGVVNYRGLKIIAKRNNKSIPRTDEIFDQLGRAKYYPTIDLKTGFYQIRIYPNDIEKTAITKTHRVHLSIGKLQWVYATRPALFKLALILFFKSCRQVHGNIFR